MNKKYIFRQIDPEYTELSFYFDNDCFTEAAGDYCYTLFIIDNDGWNRYNGINIEEYKRIIDDMNGFIDDCSAVKDGLTDYDGNLYTYKRVMFDYGMKYNSRKCHKIKEWLETADTSDNDDIAQYLEFKTDRPWTVTSARGYCQGDYVEVIYCPEHYTKENAQAAGEVYLGAANEYCFIDLTTGTDEESADHVYGYIIADCQAWKDEDIKKLLCDREGIKPEETELQLIDDCKVVDRHEYSYRTA